MERELEPAPGSLTASEQYLRSIIECSLDMIITTDNERRIVEFNGAAQGTFGYTREEVLGQPIHMLYADLEEARAVHQVVVEEGKFVGEIRNRRKNGEVFISLLSAAVLRDSSGHKLGIVGISRDITERKRMEEKLRYFSMHDSLTGLYNRAYFEEEMARLEGGRRFPLSILMADVDHLKATNDRFGHAAGDELLRQAAEIFRMTFRTEDVVARMGGDEFAVLLPDTDTEVARLILERLRMNLARHNAAHPGASLSLSFGLATADPGAALTQVLKQADEGMYQDKRKEEDRS